MNVRILRLSICASLGFTASAWPATQIGYVENTTVGEFLSSSGLSLSSGGVSIGFFTSAPADSAFGLSITNWSQLLAAGYKDVRTLPSVDLTGLDWDYASVSGTVGNVPFSSTTTTSSALAQNTQLYLFAFNSGSFNLATPANSFLGSTQWAVVKDNANLTAADGGTRNIVLSTATGGSEILQGADSGAINITLTAMVPEPSAIVMVGAGLFGILAYRRRPSFR